MSFTDGLWILYLIGTIAGCILLWRMARGWLAVLRHLLCLSALVILLTPMAVQSDNGMHHAPALAGVLTWVIGDPVGPDALRRLGLCLGLVLFVYALLWLCAFAVRQLRAP